ncbi:MAG: protein kinase [Chlamydiales bacterium]|nr:protein kinase [Chlamydiales bacterium]
MEDYNKHNYQEPRFPPHKDNDAEESVKRGEQLGLGKRLSIQPTSTPAIDEVREVIEQKPIEQAQTTLGYLTSLIGRVLGGSAAKVEEVARNTSLMGEVEDLAGLQNEARELGIPDAKIAGASDADELEKMVRLRQKTLKHYDSILNNHNTKQGEEGTTLTASLLQKVIKSALKNNVGSYGSVIEKEGQTFLVQRLKGQQIQITQPTQHILGTGVYGTVNKALNVTTGKPMALKIAKPGAEGLSQTRTNRALRREASNLQRANGNRTHTVGVQPAAHVFFEVTNKERKAHGYLIDLYDLSLDQLAESPNVNIQTQINYLTQLFTGLAFVHDAKLVHKDIKPNNIGIKEDEAYLADFGEAIPTDQILERGINGVMTYISSFFDSQIYHLEEESVWYPVRDSFHFNNAVLDFNEDLAREILEKADVCALGRCAFYSFSRGEYVDECRSKDVPSEVVAILDRTQDPEPLNRPSALEVANILRSYSNNTAL